MKDGSIINHIEEIKLGWTVWNKIAHGDDIYVLFPRFSKFLEKKNEICSYLKKMECKMKCIITDDKNFGEFEWGRTVYISSAEVNALVQYYKFYRFTDKLFVVDISIYSEKIQEILSNFSDDEIIYIGLFRESRIPLL